MLGSKTGSKTLGSDSKTDNIDNIDHIESQDQQIVLASDGPFEAPAQTFVPGPYYAAVEEVMEDMAATEADVAGDYADLRHQSFPLDRRDFLKLFSLSALAGSVKACVPRPVEHMLPYVDQPVDTVPGIAKHYATTCGECAASCGVQVKTKDGRPIKLEGLSAHPVNKGALCATGQASIQGLYHPQRLKHPMMSVGARVLEASWEDIWQRLGDACKQTTKIGILTRGVTGSVRGFYKAFLEGLGSSAENVYFVDSRSLYATVDKAHHLAFGRTGIPRTVLSKAEMILGVSSDFFETGLSPIFDSKNFSRGIGYKNQGGKSLKGRFIQCESVMSITGAKADKRHSIPVGSELPFLVLILSHLLSRSSQLKASSSDISKARGVLAVFKDQLKGYRTLFTSLDSGYFDKLVGELLARPAVIMAGGVATCTQDATRIQLLAVVCNVLIGAYESILFTSESWMLNPLESFAKSSSGVENSTEQGQQQQQQKQQEIMSSDMMRFFGKASELDILLVIDCDPVQSIPRSFDVSGVLSDIETVISIQSFPRMVDTYADYVLPMHHYLESWGDSEAYAGFIGMRQPSVRPLYGSFQAEDMLLWISAAAGRSMGYESYRVYLFEQWKKIYDKLNIADVSFSLFIQNNLRKGFFGVPGKRNKAALMDVASYFSSSGGSGSMNSAGINSWSDVSGGSLKLIAPLDAKLADGRHGHLPILQEVGDAMSTVCWDSFAAMSPYTCRKLGVKRNDVIRIRGKNGGAIEVAVFPMPGVAHDAVVVSQGRGIDDERNTIAHGVGVNPLDVVSKEWDPLSYQMVTSAVDVKVEPTGKRYRLAAMQKHNDIANRSDVYRKVGFSELEHKIEKRRGHTPKNLDDVPDLYPSLDKPETYMHKQDNSSKPGGVEPRHLDYRWGMSIDLDRCTGCGACMVACSLENNVAQVGRDQVNLGREMFWIRLDRYFDGAVDEPGVSFQPVMCQQCNHAPCEAVCPVFATTHDPEGINAMTYNRCVGTRYCANACPYKVRRFNWWTHSFGKVGKRLQDRTPRALNPDVTVRTRGVMEKCNFCVGRIRDAKHRLQRVNVEKHMDNHRIPSDWIKTACQETCPSDAISFGNLKEPGSLVTRLRRDERAYLMLGGDPDHKHYGIKTLPNVSYLAEVVAEDLTDGHTSKGEPSGSDHG
ncbi:MAG: 4Fe-4S dicluster domain-containing protein [Proteobacteria bacterium]|nr:4Fe-4S dicluster domain-containing protein [Pseudomonadota bacterium]